MHLICNIYINTFSALMLSIICIYSRKYSETRTLQNRIYMWSVYASILMLFLDSFSRLDGYPDTIMSVLNQLGNLLIYLFNPVVPSLWVLYAFYFKCQTPRNGKKVLITVITVSITNCLLVVLNLWNGWFYYIDSENIYHRGPLFPVSTIFTFLLMFIATFIIYKKRKRIERKHYFALLFFPVPPFMCIILQILFYGYSLSYIGVALSSLIVFLYVQNQDVFTDYLTGIANRKKLEYHFKKMISNSIPDKTFSAIMIDLDNFKVINDTLGHKAGDAALQTAAEVLKSCIGKQDFIARYGGDEFCIVLDTSDATVLENTVDGIKKNIENYNINSNEPYKLGLSMGHAIYQYGTVIDDFENKIDKLMYEDKHNDYLSYL